MAKELKITLAEKTPEQIHIFRIEGSLGVEGAAGVQGLLDACLKAKVHRLVVDFDGVTFVSSAGMGALLAAVGELRKNGGDMLLARLNEKIQNVFRNLDVLDYFVVTDDVAQAVECFRGGKLPHPPSLEELTTAAAERLAAEDPGLTRTIFSLLAAYADILVGEGELSPKLAQLVDITANYLSLEECAFVPLSEDLGLATTSARGIAVAPPAGVKGILTAALAGKEVVAVEQFPGMNKEIANWFGRSRVHFLFPLEINRKVAAVIVASDKKGGQAMAGDERRIVRYLRASLNLALAAHLATKRPASLSPAAEKQVERKLMEMETLFTIAHEMAEALDIEKMLPTFLMMLTGQFSTERAAVLLETEEGDIKIRAARGVDEGRWPSFTLPPRGLVERLDEATRPQPVAVLSLVLDEAERSQLTPFVKNGLVVLAPLRFKGRTFGVAALGEKISGRDFDVDELKLFAALVDLAAVSFETARLLSRINETYSGLVRALINALEAKDRYTRGHTERVTRYAAALAAELGLSEDIKQDLLFGAVVHDLGYIGVPEDILQMPDGITPEQLAELRRHPEIGVNILKGIPLFAKALAAVRHHHEHYDGTGYPDGLAGENIPLLARVLAVADAFDAMTSERRYRKAKTVEEAVAEIKKNRGAQFDPYVADIFMGLITSGRLGVIKSKD